MLGLCLVVSLLIIQTFMRLILLNCRTVEAIFIYIYFVVRPEVVKQMITDVLTQIAALTQKAVNPQTKKFVFHEKIVMLIKHQLLEKEFPMYITQRLYLTSNRLQMGHGFTHMFHGSFVKSWQTNITKSMIANSNAEQK